MIVIDQAVGFRQRMNERSSQFFMIYIDIFKAAQTRGDFRGSSWLSCRESLEWVHFDALIRCHISAYNILYNIILFNRQITILHKIQ